VNTSRNHPEADYSAILHPYQLVPVHGTMDHGQVVSPLSIWAATVIGHLMRWFPAHHPLPAMFTTESRTPTSLGLFFNAVMQAVQMFGYTDFVSLFLRRVVSLFFSNNGLIPVTLPQMPQEGCLGTTILRRADDCPHSLECIPWVTRRCILESREAVVPNELGGQPVPAVDPTDTELRGGQWAKLINMRGVQARRGMQPVLTTEPKTLSVTSFTSVLRITLLRQHLQLLATQDRISSGLIISVDKDPVTIEHVANEIFSTLCQPYLRLSPIYAKCGNTCCIDLVDCARHMHAQGFTRFWANWTEVLGDV
jgi:hypothetical protein